MRFSVDIHKHSRKGRSVLALAILRLVPLCFSLDIQKHSRKGVLALALLCELHPVKPVPDA